MIEVMTFENAREDIIASDHKSAALFSKNGDKIIPYNSKSVKLIDRLNEIGRRMESKSMPDGIYQLKARHYGQDAVPAVYYVSKGDISTGLQEIEVKSKEVPATLNAHLSEYTPKEYKTLFEQKVELDYKVKAQANEIRELKDQVANLEADIDAMLEDEPESTGLLSENNQKFLSGTVEQLTPLFDKMLQQKDTAQQIEILKLQMQMNGGKPLTPPGQQPVQQPTMHSEHLEDDALTEEEEAHLDAMEILKTQNPELYEVAMQRLNDYNQAENDGE